MFDNIYVGQSIEESQKLAEETYKLKRVAEPSKLSDPVEGVNTCNLNFLECE